MVMAIATTIAVWSVLSAPEVSATNSVWTNRAIDALMRYNAIQCGAVTGWWTYYWFNVLNEPKVSPVPGSALWFAKRDLIAKYVIAGMVCWCLALRV